MKHLSRWRNEKGCHDNYNGNGAAVTYPMIRQFVKVPVQKNKCAKHARVMWSDPGNQVPTGRQHGKQGGTCKDISDTVQTRASHTTHMHTVHGIVSGLYLRSVHIWGGSSSSREVEEVVLHVQEVVEIWVFDNGHCTCSEVVSRGCRDLGDGSGTLFGRCPMSSVEVLGSSLYLASGGVLGEPRTYMYTC